MAIVWLNLPNSGIKIIIRHELEKRRYASFEDWTIL